jgi:hypothetical protein
MGTDMRLTPVESQSTASGRAMALPAARAAGAVALLVTGGVHYEQYTVAHFSVIPTIGSLFLLNFIAASVLGLILLLPIRRTAGRARLLSDAAAAMAGIGVAAGALTALMISEQTPLFGFTEQGYRLEIVIAIVAEAVAIASLGFALVCLRGRIRAVRATATSNGQVALGLPPRPTAET